MELSKKLDRCSLMGIINITPNSFSDGGEYNSVDSFNNRISEFKRERYVLDVGAESTAPFNDPITGSEEIERFKKTFLPVLQGKLSLPSVISIDTYRPETFEQVYLMIKKYRPETTVIWNDVSGIVDEITFELFEKYNDFYYVYCHANVSSREFVSDHMESLFENGDKFIESVIEYFEGGSKVFHKQNCEERVLFDPAFGFSKSYNQNIDLIKNIKILINSFDKQIGWVLGISRKSFLKKLVSYETKESDRRIQSEFMSASIMTSWFNTFSDNFILYRVHDPTLFDACVISHKLTT